MSNYWEKRFLSIWLFNEHEDKRYLRQMNKRMETLQNSLSESMNDFIARWATQDGLSLDDMRALISKEDQRKWKMTLKEFREKAIDGGYEEELNREYFRSRISRVEQLRGQLYLQGVEAAVIERQELETHLLNQKQETFFRTIYELSNRGQIDFGINWEKYNENMLRRTLTTKWDGGNFSTRIWGNLTKELPERLTNVLSQAAVSGWGIDKMRLELSRGITGVTKSRMTTLVQTESTHIAELAAFDGYRETNVEQWQWMATLEVNTCVHCASLDTQVFEVDGNQDPPPGGSHPNCRCRSIPYVEGWVHLKRWSRNPETGKGERVDFVPYEEWKQGKTGNTKENDVTAIMNKIDMNKAKPQDLINLGKIVNEKHGVSDILGDKEKLTEVFNKYRPMGGAIPEESWFTRSNKLVKAQLQESFKYYPTDWSKYIVDNNKKIFAGKTDRGFFYKDLVNSSVSNYLKGASMNDGVSIYSNGVKATTAWHEIGHMVDFFNPNLVRIEKEWIESRTAGEKEIPLSKIFPGFGYKRNEKTKKDNFISPYIGKSYSNATEVLSMGLESIYEPDGGKLTKIEKDGTRVYNRIDKDKDYLHLIIGLILKG